MNFSGSNKTRVFICFGLALAVFGVYWQVHGFDFVNYDDPEYVSHNPMVARGLTFQGIAWAFTHFYAANWHPLTWISHMLDAQIFGVKPGGPHVVNVLFHAANSILLFLLLRRMTGAQWPSAIIAAIFAVHPLHVESVAWISERKDVLSTFFGLLSLLAYVRYVEETKTGNSKTKASFVAALVLFALSLMSKPMLVTLPCLMLLLDVWPLQRIENTGWRTFFNRKFGALVVEKWPWFALVILLCVTTLFAQTSATVTSQTFPVQWRLPNAIDSYFWYLEKTFWPTNLAFFYPLIHAIPIKTFTVAVITLTVISVAAIAFIKRWPFFFVGWAWFLGTLVPVIGLVQVGAQATADRYSYISMVGLLIAVVTGAQLLLSRSRIRIIAGGIAATVLLAVLAAAAFLQARYWKNSFTLCSHALDVTHDNVVAANNLGVYFFANGRNDDAEKMYRVALATGFAPQVHENLGAVLEKKGDTNSALAEYQEAVRTEPKNATFQNQLAETLVRVGKNEEALPHMSEAARLQPDNAQYQNDLAAILVALGKREEALPFYSRAVQLQPDNAQYQNNYATALLRAGDLNTAEQHFRSAIQDDPKFAEPYSNLGALLFARRQFADSADVFSQAVRLSPTNAGIHFNAGLAYLKAHRIDDAKAQFNEASRLRPDWPEPLLAEAWPLATSSDDRVRNGAEAVKLAEKAATLTGHQQPAALHTLAAAYAEAGRFDDALATANQGLQLAKQSNHTNLFPRFEHAITLYQAHTPWRETSE